MGRLGLVTDSTAYLEPQYATEHGIKVVPLVVNLAGETFFEGEGYSNAKFYQRLRNEKVFPTTSQPSPGQFQEAYSELAGSCESIISIHISSLLSGTVSSAQAAATMFPDKDIVVVDSLNTSAGLAFMVQKAVEVTAQGGTKKDVLREIEFIEKEIHLFFMVDTLEYLHRGGRIGGAQALLGQVLQIKPLLSLQKGSIEVFEKVRTRRKALEKLLDELAAYGRNLVSFEGIKLKIVHVDAPDDAQGLLAEVEQRFPGIEAGMAEMGPVIGSHAGPGTLGLAFYGPPQNR